MFDLLGRICLKKTQPIFVESFGSIMHKKGFKNLPATQGWHDLSNEHLMPPWSRPTITTCSSGISWPPAASRTTALKKSGLLWWAKIHLPRAFLPKCLRKMYTRCSPQKKIPGKKSHNLPETKLPVAQNLETLCACSRKCSCRRKMLIHKDLRYLIYIFICSITRVCRYQKNTKQPRTWSGNWRYKNPKIHCFNVHIHPWVVPYPVGLVKT